MLPRFSLLPLVGVIAKLKANWKNIKKIQGIKKAPEIKNEEPPTTLKYDPGPKLYVHYKHSARGFTQKVYRSLYQIDEIINKIDQ